MGPTRLYTAALLVAAALALAPGGAALAQCPMCGKTAEYAGTKPGEASRTLVSAVLVLLVPAMGVMGGMGALLWRHRGRGGSDSG